MFWSLLMAAAGLFEDGVRLSGEGRWAEARVKFAEAVRLESARGERRRIGGYG